MRKKITIAAACMVVAGCMTSGAYVEPKNAAALQKTITTAEELEKALGVPSVTIPRDDGKTMWVYQGIYKRAGASSYIPYINLVAGTNQKNCTRLTVLVDRESGKLSNWEYASANDSEFWAKTNDKCHSTADKSGKAAP
jgi:hypothetical protein